MIKTSKIGTKQPLFIPYFSDNPVLCPAQTLLTYIEKTAHFREYDYLFLTFKKPHHPASTQSLSRWIKDILKDSGIDVSIFSAHSTRHATTSRAWAYGVTIDQIREAAGWSDRSNTFGKFYNRKIITTDEQVSVANAILNS